MASPRPLYGSETAAAALPAEPDIEAGPLDTLLDSEEPAAAEPEVPR